MADGMYFGTKKNMKWVPAPRISVTRTPIKHGSTIQYVSGGVLNNTSAVGAMQYEFDWSLKSEEALRHVRHCASGLYSPLASVDENPLVYFLDPFAMEANILPSYWSAPVLSYRGAPRIGGLSDMSGSPLILDTGTYAQEYPNPSIQVFGGGDSLWIPIPDGYTFHLGAHGLVSFGDIADVFVTATPDGGASTNLTLLAPDSSVRTNYSTAGTGVTLSITGRTFYSESIYVALSGLIAQILPTGQAVQPGGFILGRGHSGCEFTSDGFEEGGYSAALNLEQFSATLVETGAWK